MARLAKEVQESIGYIETEIRWAQHEGDLPTLNELRKELVELEGLAVNAIQSVAKNDD